MGEILKLYHTGYQEIREPDVHYGRRNADFAQGFYTTKDAEFARRWARVRKGQTTFMNAYELDLSGLCVRHFDRDAEWFDYIFRNRANQKDIFPEADVIIGPIANDTIYDTFGVITSGYLKPEESLRLLLEGPAYEQTVLKTDKAAARLRWLGAEVLKEEDIQKYRQTVTTEETAYLKAITALMEKM